MLMPLCIVIQASGARWAAALQSSASTGVCFDAQSAHYNVKAKPDRSGVSFSKCMDV